MIDDDDARCQPELLGLSPTRTDVHHVAAHRSAGLSAASERVRVRRRPRRHHGQHDDEGDPLDQDDLTPTSFNLATLLIGYHGESHRVSDVDRQMGWSWPIAFDDAGWAMALGHDPVVVPTARFECHVDQTPDGRSMRAFGRSTSRAGSGGRAHLAHPLLPNETVNRMVPSRHVAVTVEGAECGGVMRNGEGRREVVWPSDDGNTEPAIKVLMDRDRVVVRPVGPLDADALRALVDLLGCAREAGIVALVDLDGTELGDPTGSGVGARLITDGSQRYVVPVLRTAERQRSRRSAPPPAIVRACRSRRAGKRATVRLSGRAGPDAQAAHDRSLASHPPLRERLGDHPPVIRTMHVRRVFER